MIELTTGNLLKADVDAIVNTVNCSGFMGKGIALQFKQAYPENFEAYSRVCKKGMLQPGQMLVFEVQSVTGPQYIINFPTKRHWREKSRLEDIEAGLKSLVAETQRLQIRSIAIPPLGCGLGGLDWNDVRALIESAFTELPDLHVLLFAPAGSPAASEMPIRTKRAKMTHARALFIKLMQRYNEMAYRLTLLEIQKLAYFLQEAGEPLKLRYVAHIYGPYAENLNKVLQTTEGHFTRGFGDSPKPDRDIELLPGSVEEAEQFIDPNSESFKRLHLVGDLINGFETPYGMELLSSVHWVCKHSGIADIHVGDVVRRVHAWNTRKRRLFRPDHIATAFNRLAEFSFISAQESSGT